ncbi:hypothetical protein CBR_g50991 [Chara braunii]|uniref:Uncharacterized protein n=1 Tax=Chara braunii TaxID=69332 RepID=A0A388M829_CHABU|nr:hypothetical protein CBR_g50991 [Chara braunii]|eukprot:GBG90643.1 hypothetical protein CBR_g50991 [Chara braunii]
MLRCTFCNKVWQGTQYYVTKHFTQPQYCQKVSDEALFDIAQKCTHRFEADEAERVRHYAQERGLHVLRSGAMGGEAEWSGQGVGGGEDTMRWFEGGAVRDGAGADVAEEGAAGVDRERSMAEGERMATGERAVPKVDPVTCQRTRGWDPVGKRPVPPEIPSTPSSFRTPVRDTPGSSIRKDRGADLPATQAGKRLGQQRVTDTYGGEWIGRWRKAFFRWAYSSGVAFNAFRNTPWRDLHQVALQHPGGGPLPVLPSHSEITSMRAVEIHRQELAEELEEVRQPFWSSGATLLSGGRRSKDGRPIVNFLAVGSRGVVIYTTINQEAERNWAVHEGIHTKKRNQLAFEKVVHLVEITANVRLMEYRCASCGYVLPWERDEGMLDAQAGIELDPVRSGMRSSMMQEEIEEQAALISRDPIGSSAPPQAESVFDARAAIFQPYPRDDASGDERERECAEDPALPIPRRLTNGTALVEGEDNVVEGDVAHDRGEGSDTLDPIVERFIADEVGPALSGLTPGTMRALGASPSGESAAVGDEMRDFAQMSFGDPPTPRQSRNAEIEDIARALVAAGHSAEEIEQAFAGASRTRTPDMLQQGYEEAREHPLEEHYDAAVAEIPRDSGPLVQFTGMQLTTTTRPVRPCVQGLGSEEVAPDEVPPVVVVDLGSDPPLQTSVSGRRAPEDTACPFHAAKLARAVVHNVTRQEDTYLRRPASDITGLCRRSAAYRDSRPRPVPAAGCAALGESSGAEGLGMPRGSRRDKIVEVVTRASTRLVQVRRGDDHVIVEEDDPETEPACDEDPPEDDEYREDDESREEERDYEEEDDDDDDDEPSPRPRRGSGRRQEEFRETRRHTRSRGPSTATEASRRGVSQTGSPGHERRRGSGKGKRGRWS